MNDQLKYSALPRAAGFDLDRRGEFCEPAGELLREPTRKPLIAVASMPTSSTNAASRFLSAGLLLLALLAGHTADAQVLTGSIVNYPESDPFYTFSFGDGTHSVHLAWSVNILDRSGYFYRNWYTEVALASGVSAINQITNAGAFSFTTPVSYDIGPVFDAAYTGGRNSFVVLKSATDNFFGVVRVDDIFRYATPIDHGVYGKSYSGLNATWWFQPDGTGDFSMVPEPQALSLLGLALTAFLWRGIPRTQPDAGSEPRSCPLSAR